MIVLIGIIKSDSNIYDSCGDLIDTGFRFFDTESRLIIDMSRVEAKQKMLSGLLDVVNLKLVNNRFRGTPNGLYAYQVVNLAVQPKNEFLVLLTWGDSLDFFSVVSVTGNITMLTRQTFINKLLSGNITRISKDFARHILNNSIK